ncbi:MAG: FAD/NAD(P)-binding protein [Planctomycetales bacterium]|nr:FAD/NAD(P)-binding protein [Planctomycetales bacterium]
MRPRESLRNRQVNDPWHILPVQIVRTIAETTDVVTFEFAFDDPTVAQEYHFSPGQFNMLYVPGYGEAAISIAGKTPRNGVLHTIRIVGDVTHAIARGGLGMHLGLRGPFGNPWPVESLCSRVKKPSIVVIAGGVGLAPLRDLILTLIDRRKDFASIHLLLGARTPSDILYRYEIDDWELAGLDVHTTVDRSNSRWRGNVGVVTLLLERLSLPECESTFVLTCGPEVMMRYATKTSMERGIPDSNIWLALERNMNCGIGICGHCQLGPQFLCKDGPVFPFANVRDWLRVQDL